MSGQGSLKKSVQKAQGGAPTNAQQRNDLFQRVGRLEVAIQNLSQQAQAALEKLSQRLNVTNQALAAVCELLGTETVHAKATEMHIRELETEAEAQAAQVLDAVEKGQLISTETVGKNCPMVVTQQTGANGQVLHPSRVHLPLEGYSPEVQALLEGKATGDVIELPDGSKLTVLASYAVVVPPTEPIETPSETTPETAPQA